MKNFVRVFGEGGKKGVGHPGMEVARGLGV